MFEQLEISRELSSDTVLYRIVDFFSAAQIIGLQRFMLSRPDAFPDKNEGVDRLLMQLEVSLGAKGCGGMGWADRESAKNALRKWQCSHYVSCWSQTKDSVAMWSLYSPDLTSIMISTTVRKLQALTDNFINEYCFLRLSDSDRGKYVIICSDAYMAPVKYISLNEVLKKISRHVKAYRRLEASGRIKPQSAFHIGTDGRSSLVRAWQRRYFRDNKSFLHKDMWLLPCFRKSGII